MAFFDDISKKITQTGQSAVQKTRDMTEVARLNGAVSDEEKKINSLYLQVGKLYMAIHSNDYESDFAGMISAIRDSETKIQQYKQQIEDIKGITHCEKCGAEVPNNVLFCSVCGNAMPKVNAEDFANMVRCSGCGNMVPKDMRFCTHCGKPMAVAPVAPVAPVEPPVLTPPVYAEPVEPVAPAAPIAPVEPAAPQPDPFAYAEQPAVPTEDIFSNNAPAAESVQAFCTNCGAKLEPGTIFCTECGTKI